MACLYPVSSDNYIDFITPYNPMGVQDIVDMNLDSCFDYAGPYSLITYVPTTSAMSILPNQYSYLITPKLYTLLDTSSMTASGIQSTFNQPYLNLRGQGTLIGFIDTGIDYRNPLFLNADGTSRIMGIWDQTIESPPVDPIPSDEDGPLYHPDGFLYGTRYTQAQINEALASPDPLEIVPSIDQDGHGTFMAGIAAGGESVTHNFLGAAPSCSIAVVKLKPAKQYLRELYCIQDSAVAYQENDIMMALKYLEHLSLENNIPLVIYMGVGTNAGSHEGTSPLSMMLRRLNRLPGVVSVHPAGNEAGFRHHYLGTMFPSQEYIDVEIRVGPNENGFVVELWATQPELFTVGFVSPTGQVIPRTPLTQTTSTTISFVMEATQISIGYQIAENASGGENISLRFKNPTPGIWRVRVYNSLYITGVFHIWLPIRGFISDETYFLNSNPNTSIVEPGNVPNVITVGAYDHQSNGLYIHSSRGFSRDNYIKPELVAPGVSVYGPGLPPDTPNLIFPMIRRTGTSVAAAHVAGAAANLLTWGIIYRNDITITSATVKAHLIRGADRSDAYMYPNREFGYGSLNLYSSFTTLRE